MSRTHYTAPCRSFNLPEATVFLHKVVFRVLPTSLFTRYLLNHELSFVLDSDVLKNNLCEKYKELFKIYIGNPKLPDTATYYSILGKSVLIYKVRIIRISCGGI